MKKVLLMFCFVSTALGVFASDNNTGDVQVTAQVVKKLDITTESLDFGTVVANTKDNKPEKYGKIIINTKDNEQEIRMKFADESGLNWTDDPSKLKIKLKNKQNLGSELIYIPTIAKNQLNKMKGNITMDVTGTLSVPENASVGNYSGVLKVKVWYDEI